MPEIQVERTFLFETSVADPLFLNTVDGVTVKMFNSRTIDLLSLVTVYFEFNSCTRASFNYRIGFGGEDFDIGSYGKSQNRYELSVNMPSSNQRYLEELIGKEFSILCMRRDLSNFVIFGKFVADPTSFDNEIQQRVIFKTGDTNARIYEVLSYDIEEIINVIDPDEFGTGGFDYTEDFAMD